MSISLPTFFKFENDQINVGQEWMKKLSEASGYFNALPSFKEGVVGEVILKDVDPLEFNLMITHFILDQRIEDPNLALALLKLGQRFQLDLFEHGKKSFSNFLKSIDLHQLTSEELEYLNELAELNHTYLNQKISNLVRDTLSGHAIIPSLKLKELRISNIGVISCDSLILALPSLTQLQKLDLSHTVTLTKELLHSVAFLPQLTALNLEQKSSFFFERKIAFLGHLPRLTDLNLGHSFVRDTSNRISQLGTLNQLTRLNLSTCGICDQDLLCLTPLSGLRTLNLSMNKLKNPVALNALTGLTSLDLSHNKITSLRDLSLLTQLTELDTTNCE